MNDDDYFTHLEGELSPDPLAELTEWFTPELADHGIAFLTMALRRKWEAPHADVPQQMIAALFAELDDQDRRALRGRSHAEHAVGADWQTVVLAWGASSGHLPEGLTEAQHLAASCFVWDGTAPAIRDHAIALFRADHPGQDTPHA